ncbi:MAG: ABC transporter ATP-binding protein [Patescibacteria group bacterium]
MEYDLAKITESRESSSKKEDSMTVREVISRMRFLMRDEKKNFILALIAILLDSAFNLLGPLIVGYTIDTYVQGEDYHGVLVFSGILLAVYILEFIASYVQMKIMGGVGQRTLFSLRNTLFVKLQSLPLAFFNANRTGDLISRINDDTQKLNNFFSETIMRFLGSIFVLAGAAIFIVVINWKLGIAALIPAVVITVFSQLVSGRVKHRSKLSLRANGALSSEIQESLTNFRVVVAFNRRDYFRQKFSEKNTENYKAAMRAGLWNDFFGPGYDFMNYGAQLIVLVYGIYLISLGQFGVGLLVSFLLYVSRFYDPLRMMAVLWTQFQSALASWDRVSEILSLESNLKVVPDDSKNKSNNASQPVIEFKDVSFHYSNGTEVLRNINFKMEKGKTYALVGPTGGGKTTTASLLARLYDPTSGKVLLNGQDIRSYEAVERTSKIGFILQEPFLFTGTVRENLLYGNEKYADYTNEKFVEVLKEAGLEKLLSRFEKGLDTPTSTTDTSMSLGQRQIIAFMRAMLRHPEILILDEATANIDTITEELLEEILKKLPKETTRVIIAHRLNTIESADEIFFVNGGEIKAAGSLEHAMDMLMKGQRRS